MSHVAVGYDDLLLAIMNQQPRLESTSLPDGFWTVLDQLVERSRVSFTPILAKRDWRWPKYEGVGTAFVLMEKGTAYLVTAAHVLDCAFSHKEVIATLFNKIVNLHGLYFASDEENDVAVTLLPRRWLDSYGIGDLYAPSVAQLSSAYQRTGQYILLGYPASRNRFDPRSRGKQVTGAWFTSKPTTPIEVKTSMPSAQFFEYDVKGPEGRALPAPQGMSGGPVWELIFRTMQGATTGISLYPRGIICEHHKKNRVIAAAPIEVALKLIEERAFVWKIAADSHGRAFPSVHAK